MRRTRSKSRSVRNGRCAPRNWIYLKISLQYHVSNWCESSSILLLLPSPKSSSERSFNRASADWNDLILKLSSPNLRGWSMHGYIGWLNDRASWMLCADRNGCHGFHCSELIWCLLYNPVALLYDVPPGLSTPTTSLCATVSVVSGV